MKNLPVLHPRLPDGHELVPTYGGFRCYLVALFSVVNPVGDAPMFPALTKSYPQSVRQKLAGSFLFGTLILDSEL